MDPPDTALGGPGRILPTTVWSDVLSAADPADPDCAGCLDRLVRAYWKPVYAYVRTAWHKDVEDAKDLTQAFFAHVLEHGYIARMRPEKGSFRGYLKRALKHFLIDADRADRARRPKQPLVPLEMAPEEVDRIGDRPSEDTPEAAYDREWFRTVFEAALLKVRQELEKEGKGVYLEVFRAYCLDELLPAAATGTTPEPGAPTYREIAEKLKLSHTQVRHYLSVCRTKMRKVLRDVIRDYASSEDEADREMEDLLRP
ncbi:MAG: sigma-70 family RNA polymerase sigma factor [Planctomycetes bacterium]|nr:sigma-70 family RNA polymerase sigma factor [Planctomycetota bacterium]